MRAIVPILILAAQQVAPAAGPDLFKRMASRLPLEVVRADSGSELAGHYTGQTSELQSRVGPFLSGEDLYLFPDGSYLYCQWADVMPRTIYDKGRWLASDGVLSLVSDSDVRWEPEVERQHLLVRRERRKNEILLIGVPRSLKHFEEQAAEDPELILLIAGKARVEVFGANRWPSVKARLMKEAWNPSYFRK